jgi:hypothetical protein
MKYSVVTNFNNGDIQSAIEEEQLQFIVAVLESMSVPIDNCFPEVLNPKLITQEHKNNFSIIHNSDKTFDIFLERDKVASWFRHWVEMKKDFSHPDPKKRIYVEIHLECWSVFEGEQNE